MALFKPPSVQKLLDKRDLQGLIKALGDEMRRDEAIVAVGELGDQAAVEPLVEILQDEEEYSQVRARAALALGDLHDSRAVEPLIGALEAAGVREEASTALAELGDARAVPPLILHLSKHGEDDVSVLALSKLGEPAFEPLVAALENATDQYTHLNAARALGALGDRHAVEPLLRALDDDEKLEEAEYWYSCQHVVNALGSLGDTRAVPRLIELLDRFDGAGYALLAIGGEGIEDALYEHWLEHLPYWSGPPEDRMIEIAAGRRDRRAMSKLMNLRDYHGSADAGRALELIDDREGAD